MVDETGELIVLGRVSGIYGVAGWIRVYSFTDPRENILGYSRWHIWSDQGWKQLDLQAGRRQGRSVVAHLAGYDDRDQARGLIGREIAIPREQLPALDEGEYYWADLQGLRVYNRDGQDFGTVTHLIETGANDVLVVEGERERLIPMVPDEFVLRVDLEAGFMEVEWDPEF